MVYSLTVSQQFFKWTLKMGSSGLQQKISDFFSEQRWGLCHYERFSVFFPWGWPWLVGMCQCAAGHHEERCSTLWDRWGIRNAGCDRAAYKPDCSPAYISGAESTEESALAETCRAAADRHPHGSPTDKDTDCDLIHLCLDMFLRI